MSSVSARALRVDASAKVSGNALYTTDILVPGMAHAKVLRSPHAHAQILSIDTRRAARLLGVLAVVTHRDLVGMERTTGWRYKDWPILAFDRVRYVGDNVAAVAAIDEATAFAALDLIDVRYDRLPVVPSISAALASDAPEIFDVSYAKPAPAFGPGAMACSAPEPNVCYRFTFEQGDIEAAFARCDEIFEDSFEFSRAQHFHLEPYVTVARWEGEHLEVWTGTQSPFQTRAEIGRIFRIPEANVRVHVPYVGGGFGAKNNCRTEALAALLARKTGRPVRFCLSFDESFLTLSQHAAVMNLKTGVLKDGTLIARQSHIYLDAGAYSDASPLVCDKAGFRIPGVYRWEALRTNCDAVMTNTVPAGPYRGFGGPQASWAAESQIDMIARRLGIDPYDIRVKNMLRLGEPFVPGESGIDSDLKVGLDLVCERLGYHRRRRCGRGMGISVATKDGGGQHKPAEARLRITGNGSVLLQSGSVELGQGITSALAEIVAKVLKIPRAWITYSPIDTDTTPYDHGTNSASGGTVMGTAVEAAALQLRQELLQTAASVLKYPVDKLELDEWQVIHNGIRVPVQEILLHAFGDADHALEATGRYAMPEVASAPHGAETMFWECGWAGAEVEVDEGTGEVRILRLIVSGDCGAALNPAAAHGQEESAALISLGQAMFEQMVYRAGKLVTPGPLKYRVLLAADIPEGFEMIFQEQGHGPGPFGSKGAGEGSLLVVAAAIANAIDDAVGARVTKLPLSPENVFAAIAQRNAKARARTHLEGHLRVPPCGEKRLKAPSRPLLPNLNPERSAGS